MSIRSMTVIVAIAMILVLVPSTQAATFTRTSPPASYTTYHNHTVRFMVQGDGLGRGESWTQAEWYVDGWHVGTTAMSGKVSTASWSREFTEQGDFTVTARGVYTKSNLVGADPYKEISWTISVNDCQPVVARVEPEYDVTVNAGSKVTFVAAATDPGSDLRYPTWSLDSNVHETGMFYIGDGARVETGVPYIFDTPGTYAVEIHVYDWHDFSGRTNWEVTVLPADQSLVADPGGPYEGGVGQPVQFDGSGSHDSNGTIVSYAWDFGDGNIGTGVSPTHTYSTLGLYTVSLTVTDDMGVTDTATAATNIIQFNQPPVADPGGPYEGQVDQAVQFDGAGSYDLDGTIVSYDWDFGDGTMGAGVGRAHAYAAPGTYTVTLTVTDDTGGFNVVTTNAQIASVDLREVLSVSSSGGGIVTWPGEGTFEYLHGDVAVLRAEPEAGYTFTNWSGTIWDASNPLELTMTSFHRVKANFVADDSSGGPTDASCSPLAHWTLDEASGLAAQDTSPYGHHGTLVGPVLWSQGPAGFGNAAEFYGGGHIEVADESGFDLVDTMSVSAWVNIDRIPMPWTGIVTKGDSAWRLSTVENRPKFHFAVTDPAGGANWVNGLIEVRFDEWHHVAGTYDGEQIRLYVDGVEDPASPVGYTGPITTNEFPVWIGGNVQLPGRELLGGIDDVRVYGCALSEDEIQALMGLIRIREVVDNGLIDNQDRCYESLDAGTGTVVEYTAAVLNISDGASGGHFGGDVSFGVVTQGLRLQSTVDDLSLEATGVVKIPDDQAGMWTFGVNSDDGFTLQFAGHDFSSAVNGRIVPLPGGAALRFHGGRATADTLGTIDLPAGDHPFRLTYHEEVGDATLEFFAAEGIHPVFDLDVFDLVTTGACPKRSTNMLVNGGFESGVFEPWNAYGPVTTTITSNEVFEGNYSLYIDVQSGVANFWEAGIQPSSVTFKKGKKYTFSAFMKSKTGQLQINMKPEKAADPWTAFGEQMVTVTEQWQEFSVTTPVFEADVIPPGFTFHVGSAVGGFWIDGVRFYEGDYVEP